MSAQDRFKELNGNRSSLVRLWEDCAKLTVPHLMPPEGWKETDRLPTPYQGLGARAVNTLSAKLTLSLFPPDTSFFKMVVEEDILQQLEQEDPRARTTVEEQMMLYGEIVNQFIDTTDIRTATYNALRYLITFGNALIYLDNEVDTLKVFRPDKYVVLRDGSGNFTELITKESLNPSTLPEEIKDFVTTLKENNKETGKGKGTDVDLYTHVILNSDGKYEVYQEVFAQEIPDTRGTYTKESCPFISPLAWSLECGDDYGRGHVEEYLGDFQSFEALCQLSVKGAGALAKVVWLKKPNGLTRIRDLTHSETGAVIAGDPNDVGVLQASEKSVDFNVVAQEKQTIARRLSEAFLLNSSVQRDAERVTAEEIRFMAQDLDDSLGGQFSQLSNRFAKNLLLRIINRLTAKNKLPRFPKDSVKPKVVTGIEALGRGHELTKLMSFLQLGSGIPNFEMYLNTAGILKQIGEKTQVNTKSILKTEEEVQQAQQQAQMMALAQEATKPVAGAVAGGAVEQQLRNNEDGS